MGIKEDMGREKGWGKIPYKERKEANKSRWEKSKIEKMKGNRQKKGHRTGKGCVHNSASKVFNCLNSQNSLQKYTLLSIAIYHFVFLLSTQVDSTTW